MELNKIFNKYFKPSNDVINEERNTCKTCAGSCCKSMGCHISPNDLRSITFDSLKNLIDETNAISIDWWEGNPFDKNDHSIDMAFFLRIRNKNKNVLDPSWGGQCCLLTETGCPLLFQYRPKGARALIPNENGDCYTKYSKEQCAKEWYQYNDILTKLYDHYYGN